jgi:LacI family transcriptional regulator
VDYVGIDDYLSSQMVIEHLVQQNCKRIAHIAGYSHTRIYKNRLRGYSDALESHGLPVDKELIEESDLRLDDGRRIMEKFLKLPERPDAVYAAGDYAALGALQVMQENGIRVPEDVALVGFSNEPFTSFVKPAISTIIQHSEQIGILAAKAFLNRIENPLEEVSLNKMILKPELVVRSSSDRNIRRN